MGVAFSPFVEECNPSIVGKHGYLFTCTSFYYANEANINLVLRRCWNIIFSSALYFLSSHILEVVSVFLSCITEVYSGLMQLVTTSCFSNSESSHSLAIIS